MAHAQGLAALAVTDHDTISGLPRALAAADALGLELVCGVELTLRFAEPLFTGSLHMLLFFERQLLQDQDFLDETGQALSMGRGRGLVQARLAAINGLFAPGAPEPLLPRALCAEDVYAHGEQISRRHFALALRQLGLQDRQQLNRVLANDSPAYIPSGAPLEQLIPYLDRWPIARVLAHPAAGSFPGDSHYKEVLPPFEVVQQLLPRFEAAGLDGLEVHYPGHTAQWTRRLEAICVERGLVGTGGSDCHDSELRPLGSVSVPYAVVQRLKERMARRLAKI